LPDSSLRSTLPLSPTTILFPYTTLFRSGKLRCARNQPVKRARRSRALRALRSHRPSPKFPCLPPPDLSRLQSRLALDVIRPYQQDRKSTRLNSSHVAISYAVFCLKKKTK